MEFYRQATRKEIECALFVIIFSVVSSTQGRDIACQDLPLTLPEEYKCKSGQGIVWNPLLKRPACSTCSHDTFQPCENTFGQACITRNACERAGEYIQIRGTATSDNVCGYENGVKESGGEHSSPNQVPTGGRESSSTEATYAETPSWKKWYWWVTGIGILIILPTYALILYRCRYCKKWRGKEKGKKNRPIHLVNGMTHTNGAIIQALDSSEVQPLTEYPVHNNGHIPDGSHGFTNNEGLRNGVSDRGTSGGETERKKPVEHGDLEVDAQIDDTGSGHAITTSGSTSDIQVDMAPPMESNITAQGQIHQPEGPEQLTSPQPNFVGGNTNTVEETSGQGITPGGTPNANGAVQTQQS